MLENKEEPIKAEHRKQLFSSIPWACHLVSCLLGVSSFRWKDDYCMGEGDHQFQKMLDLGSGKLSPQLGASEKWCSYWDVELFKGVLDFAFEGDIGTPFCTLPFPVIKRNLPLHISSSDSQPHHTPKITETKDAWLKPSMQPM